MQADRLPATELQDKNNMQVAEVIQKWLVGKGLAD